VIFDYLHVFVVFLYYCARQEFHLAPTYLQVRWRNQSYVVLGQENVFVLIDFIYENDLVVLGEKFA